MAFCTNCGAEISAGARFCNSCGKEQIPSENTCSKCGKVLEEKEKFCSSCGTPVKNESGKPSQKTKPEEQKFTDEGRKIISGGPNQNPSTKTPPPPPVNAPAKKKKSGCLGCFIAAVIILAILVVGSILVINFTTDWFDKIKEEWNKTTQVETSENQEEMAGAAENQKPGFSEPEAKNAREVVTTESKDIKSAAENLENIFEKADINALQSMLTETSAPEYKDVLNNIQPYMPDYARAFKNRKLVYSTPVFAQYAFSDEQGNDFTVEFTLTGDGIWKLVRF